MFKNLFWLIIILTFSFFFLNKNNSDKKVSTKENAIKFLSEKLKRPKGQKQINLNIIEDSNSKKLNSSKYLAGTCISADEGWTFSKVTAVKDRTYEVVDCHKYKGCGRNVEVKWDIFEYEYKNGAIINCPKSK